MIRWKNSEISKERLGYPETLKWLKMRLPKIHPLNFVDQARKIENACNNMGQTLFDILVEIIRVHRDEDGVVLRLE